METMLPTENDDTTQSYEAVRLQGRELQRRNVIELANRLLTTEGPAAVTVRRLAQELDCSTKVIYTLFGSKEGLANELYLLGFDRLRQAVSAVPSGESSEGYLKQVANVYWNFALANPNLYAVMFTNAIPDFKPDPALRDTSELVLHDIIQVVMSHEQQPGKNAIDHARAFWALMHGSVSLYFSGHFADRDYARNLFDFSIHMMLMGMFQTKRKT